MRRSAFRQFTPAPMASTECAEASGLVAPDARIDDRLDVVKALARIAPIHREVLVLYYFDDMPTPRMAEALEIAPGTVLSRLARAREALKAVMEPPALSLPESSPVEAPRSNVTPFPRH
jgi:DNA-directed RNA polymerase specialized sigma24 family protein